MSLAQGDIMRYKKSDLNRKAVLLHCIVTGLESLNDLKKEELEPVEIRIQQLLKEHPEDFQDVHLGVISLQEDLNRISQLKKKAI